MANLVFDIPRTLISLLQGQYEKPELGELKGYKNFRDSWGRPLVMPVILDNILFDAVKLSITYRKQIIKTAIAGRSGTVKELIGAGDYVITLQGKLYSEDYAYPEDKVEMIKRLTDKDEAIKIENTLTDLLEINSVVIESLDLPTPEKIDIQPFTLKLLSDDEFEAILEE